MNMEIADEDSPSELHNLISPLEKSFFRDFPNYELFIFSEL